jgi:hypothetical protein
MPIPKSVTKVSKNGAVTFTDNVDAANYLIEELTRAALRDVGKFVCKLTRKAIRRRTGRVARNTQYWVRKKECDLLVGFKPGGWYGGYQELGTEKQPKIGALYNTVSDNISQIREIEAQYLSAIKDQMAAERLINEEEYLGEDEDE